MTDLTLAIATIETKLLTLAKQAERLATGLQNIAPAQQNASSSASIQYLLEIAAPLYEYATHCKKLLTTDSAEQQRVLSTLIDELIKKDEALREQHQAKNKFQFLHHALQALLEETRALSVVHAEAAKIASGPSENDAPVYVHLYNTNGIDLDSWKNLFTPAIFYEHSINRPIYQEKTQIEAFITTKPNRNQHGYLTIIVTRGDIIPMPIQKDASGSPLIKVKEGSLSFNKEVLFTHNGLTYVVQPNGELIKKN